MADRLIKLRRLTSLLSTKNLVYNKYIFWGKLAIGFFLKLRLRYFLPESTFGNGISERYWLLLRVHPIIPYYWKLVSLYPRNRNNLAFLTPVFAEYGGLDTLSSVFTMFHHPLFCRFFAAELLPGIYETSSGDDFLVLYLSSRLSKKSGAANWNLPYIIHIKIGRLDRKESPKYFLLNLFCS